MKEENKKIHDKFLRTIKNLKKTDAELVKEQKKNAKRSSYEIAESKLGEEALAYSISKKTLSLFEDEKKKQLDMIRLDPENFFAMDEKYYSDFAFLADAMKLAADTCEKNARQEAEKEVKAAKAEQKKTETKAEKPDVQEKVDNAVAKFEDRALVQVQEVWAKSEKEKENAPEFQQMMKDEWDASKLRVAASEFDNNRKK